MKEKSKIIKILFSSAFILLAGALLVSVVLSSRNRGETKIVYRDRAVVETQVDEGEFYNILFLGTDDEAGLCDVIMLVNLDVERGRATVAQIPRDTYAAYTDASYKKLNGAYASLGGAARTAEFLSGALGIDIHHYVCINLRTLGALVDAIGGVDIELPCDMRYSDAEQGLYINLKKGAAHLDGETARQFIRFRSGYANGDLGRIDAQKLFMAALFSKLADEFSPVMAAKLCAAAEGVETDLSISDMMSMGVKALGMKADSIALLTLPGKEATAESSGASYYVLSAEPTAEIMEEYFGRRKEFDSEQIFLNTRYNSFRDIYFSNMEYSVIPIKEVAENLELSVK